MFFLFIFYMFSFYYVTNGLVNFKQSSYLINYSKLKAHNWYVIGETTDFPMNQPKKIILKDRPITIWRDKINSFAGIYDVCPHRGASLSNGRIDPHSNCVVCPYHTFKFSKKGRLCATPGQKTNRSNQDFNLKTDVPYFKVVNRNDWVYLYNKPLYEISPFSHESSNTIWTEPEAYDPNFRHVQLKKKFNVDARTLTENSLDILHISEVHSFGNKKRPLPLKQKYEKIGEGHHKVSYEYLAGEDSMASKIFRINKLIVENEYILPHYTVARVIFGDFVNTIVTSALPIDEKSSMLYVKAYRNNWIFKLPFLNEAFDKITERMMEKTLCEDKGVVETIYRKYRDGNFITKYDELTKLYREDYYTFVEKMNM